MTPEAEKCWNCGCPSMSYQRAHSENSIAETASRAALDALATEVGKVPTLMRETFGPDQTNITDLIDRAAVLDAIKAYREDTK